MLSKAILSLAALAVAQVALAASNPACILTAINKFEKPADQKTLCCAESNKMKDYLKSLCPSGVEQEAVQAYQTACEEAGYGSCSSNSTSSSSSSAPYPVVYTTAYFDEGCSCTKSKAYTSTSVPASTGFATGTAAVATGSSPASPAATGSPIQPASPASTGSSSSKSAGFTGAASKNVGSVAAGLLAVAGVALAL